MTGDFYATNLDWVRGVGLRADQERREGSGAMNNAQLNTSNPAIRRILSEIKKLVRRRARLPPRRESCAVARPLQTLTPAPWCAALGAIGRV
jgi:hypothetical protein